MTQQYVQALERLAFELVPGEQRFFVQTPQATLCCAVRRAEVGDQRPQKAIVFVHGAASNASRWEDFVEKTALARSWTLLRFDLRLSVMPMTSLRYLMLLGLTLAFWSGTASVRRWCCSFVLGTRCARRAWC